MRKLILALILFPFCVYSIQAQMVEKNDTLYLNYFIAAGELGGHNEGLIIYLKNNELNATSIRYNHSSTSFILNAFTDFYKNNNNRIIFNPQEWNLYKWNLYVRQRDSLFTNALIDFYKKNINDYTILKPEWVLSKDQREYIVKTIEDIMTRPVEDNVFSNASEHYAILTKNESYVFIDRTGNWNKFLEIKKVLDIKQ
jgi:hypothetical protein